MNTKQRATQTRCATSVLCLLIPGTLVLTPLRATAALAESQPHQRLRIMVAPFSYASISPWWSGDWQIGQGLSALVEDELIKQGSFDVYSRQGAGVPTGTILRGTITHFEFERDGIGLRDGLYRPDGYRRRWRPSGSLFGVGFTETRARVGMSCQLIDAATGRILKTFDAAGSSARGSFTGFGINRGGGIYAGGVDFRSRAFQDTLIGEATRKCVSDLAQKLVKGTANLDLRAALTTSVAPTPLVGKVADVEGDTLTVTIGDDQGVRVGDVMSVEGVVKVIRDPDTGSVLEQRYTRVGTLRITSVSAHTATGRFEGKLQPKVGDRVHLD
ncbi:CsgG/HfaB family protein [Armatimonas rosea]|uniref:Curli biogenesis system outer membrane secretion channel CsgG n=1 Tax=Armatimonas rosea TaxID=685828 RepID=A0A7W9SRE4_ARMRO|nr:CsgG/HfaB family protein [Armatimonas rosea]MBB6051432.1 curli biogenesis system outer membrane secretion channel CsgG [Armatimonas rosea]